MALLTEAQRELLLQRGRQQAVARETSGEIDFVPLVKLFNPCGAGTWLLTEIEPDEPDIAWGLADLGMGCPDFGTISLAELAAYRGPLRIGIERDLHFVAMAPISVYIDAARRAGCIIETVPDPA